jgi:hypothetical protein
MTGRRTNRRAPGDGVDFLSASIPRKKTDRLRPDRMRALQAKLEASLVAMTQIKQLTRVEIVPHGASVVGLAERSRRCRPARGRSHQHGRTGQPRPPRKGNWQADSVTVSRPVRSLRTHSFASWQAKLCPGLTEPSLSDGRKT